MGWFFLVTLSLSKDMAKRILSSIQKGFEYVLDSVHRQAQHDERHGDFLDLRYTVEMHSEKAEKKIYLGGGEFESLRIHWKMTNKYIHFFFIFLLIICLPSSCDVLTTNRIFKEIEVHNTTEERLGYLTDAAW